MVLKSHYFSSSGTVFQALFWLLLLSVQTKTQAREDELTLFLFRNKILLSLHVGWLGQEKSWGKVTFQPSALLLPINSSELSPKLWFTAMAFLKTPCHVKPVWRKWWGHYGLSSLKNQYSLKNERSKLSWQVLGYEPWHILRDAQALHSLE